METLLTKLTATSLSVLIMVLNSIVYAGVGWLAWQELLPNIGYLLPKGVVELSSVQFFCVLLLVSILKGR